MGRIVDLFAEVAAEAEVSDQGIEITPDTFERLRSEWEPEDIEDALQLVHETLVQGELVAASDSLSARLVEVLGDLSSAEAFAQARAGGATLSLEVVGQLARRVAHLEEVLEHYRDEDAPDRSRFEALRHRLADLGIEEGTDAEEGGPRFTPGPQSERPDDDD
jgi:hypothetical protein